MPASTSRGTSYLVEALLKAVERSTWPAACAGWAALLGRLLKARAPAAAAASRAENLDTGTRAIFPTGILLSASQVTRSCHADRSLPGASSTRQDHSRSGADRDPGKLRVRVLDVDVGHVAALVAELGPPVV